MNKLSQKKTILVVEDNDDLRKLISEVLKYHNVIQAAHPLEALAILSNLKVDLITTDISMPFMSGDEFIRKLNSMNYKIPICVISSSIPEELKEDSKNKIIWCLEKPFQNGHLLEVISLMLNKAS